MEKYLLLIVALLGAVVFLLGPGSLQAEEQGWAENHSYSTTCAEEDNINIPLFRPGIQRYWVVATHPHYCPCAYDGCPADFSGCPPDGGSATETVYKIWDDGINVIEVVVVSPWWRPYEINVTVDGSSKSGHYVRLYRKIADEASWPQVLILYQDGNLRIKPHPPPNISDVCFGSSVIIGPALPAERPHVDIQAVSIHLYTDHAKLDITYRDGQTSRITFRVDRTQAIVEVLVNYSTSSEIPFATFRSMWVSDGNADVDRIKYAGGEFPILAGWTTLTGLWWSFRREVDSSHNRSAPDILIVIDTPALFRVERESGAVFAEGSFFGKRFETGSADIAEWVPVSEPVEPGDVLELDPTQPGYYRKARGPCSALVAGVVSTKPGFVLGDTNDITNKALLALIGIVPVKVTDEGGPIRPGDLLVASAIPGYAMRLNPELSEDCEVLGKALEGHEKRAGVILVLLMR